MVPSRPRRASPNRNDPEVARTSTARHVALGAEPVGDSAVAPRQLDADRVVAADHLRSLDLAEVVVEPCDDPVERAVVVEMIGFDVGEHGAEQREFEMGPIALVGLDDQPVAVGPLRPGAEVGDVPADDEARPHPGLGEDQHQHRGGRRLAMGAGDGKRPCPRTDRREHAGAAQHGHPGGSCLVEFDVPLGNRRRCGHRVDAVDECAVVADVHLDSGGADPFQDRMVAEIGTRHHVPHLGERDGDRAHARTADAHDVEAMRRSRGRAAGEVAATTEPPGPPSRRCGCRCGCRCRWRALRTSRWR